MIASRIEIDGMSPDVHGIVAPALGAIDNSRENIVRTKGTSVYSRRETADDAGEHASFVPIDELMVEHTNRAVVNLINTTDQSVFIANRWKISRR
jgi:hypothetical protein